MDHRRKPARRLANAGALLKLACALALCTAACSSAGDGGGDGSSVGPGTGAGGASSGALGGSGSQVPGGGGGSGAGANAPGGGGPGTTVTGGSGTSGGAGDTGSLGGTGAGGLGNAGSGLAGNGAAGGSPGTCTAPAARADNPFAGAQGYVNSEWSDKAKSVTGGERIAMQPTAVWLDRIAAIEGAENSQANGPMGVRDHLDAALEQGADYIQFVIYNLPGRDCSALASNGELKPDELARYKSEYIDAIAAIMGEPQYCGLRIVNVIEVDSLPNLVTNTGIQACATMRDNGGYVQGIAYALETLGALPNVYNYVDAAHHAWIGWDSNFGPSADLWKQVAEMAGMETVAGFITNTANYSALVEPHFTAATMVNGQSIKMSSWVGWNPYVDELSFAQALRQKLVSVGFPDSIGMLIDTSRNGWGGSARPAAASTSTDVNAFVDASRIDRRIHAGNWCNQAGAGLGERPRAAPEAGIDAYVWIKPPGESDGSSSLIENEDGKGFDRMCDPTYGGNERNGNSMTGALPDAPISGAWFPAQLSQLMANAYPPL